MCFVLAALVFLLGFVTEYRQSRRVGPYASVPTLPHAVGAAIFVVLGMANCSDIPWWVLPPAFAAGVVVFGYAIMRATRRPRQNEP